ncbi:MULTISPECIES: SH3 domain-containing protein [unclassified Paracoccus (in: a-proteobacteria)]|uniref:SH3 domain-containing protein n=1 Tax=unclassified Paracoccus (in: a-proteobacteria) TaxID=2688777 RepID=UPI0012B3D882|nr:MULTISPECIES: SH3 domain-containing protein [unclassified Paracoccus (in: a-proteobacteria)]UXU75497.1 SH3 domain-containing protein [Paracoccus sp. SMMA_5]UXU81402.1 SH3 domain-containing protein [Paracoccus sp. SMMA_5_TC]
MSFQSLRETGLRARWTLPAVLALVLMADPALSQGVQRAEPVTGPGVVTIGNIASNAAVNVRGGPGPIFPVLGTLSYGTRVKKGPCLGGGSVRWCAVEAMDGKLTGYVSAKFLVEGAPKPPGGVVDDGGPDFWAVTGIAQGQRLNIRREPSASSPALATLREGEVVRNLGCRTTQQGRWCRVRSTVGMDVTGWVAGRYLRESSGVAVPPIAVQPPQGGDGGHGPDFYVVRGLPAGDTLNVRAEPSASSTILGRLSAGARVRNLGCRQIGQSRWCRIATTGGVQVTGWVNGRYLKEG